MTDSTNNPLDSLFVGNQPLDLGLLADTIRPYIQLQREPPRVDFTWEGEQLNIKKRILSYLLGRKALCEALEPGKVEEKASPSLIEQETGIVGNSVRPALKDLRERHFVKDIGGYFVPNASLPRVSHYLSETEE